MPSQGKSVAQDAEKVKRENLAMGCDLQFGTNPFTIWVHDMESNMKTKRLLLTGATGLIGKELAEPLLRAGFEVHAITIDRENPENGVHWLPGSLFDEGFVQGVVESLRPTHLLNMAWATTGNYLQSDVNYDFLAAGIRLARLFAQNGGERAVYAGSCFEFEFQDRPLLECDPLLPERNTYTYCKNTLREVAGRIFATHGVSFGYGRIFYVYGRKEAKTRLAGRIVDQLQQGLPVTITAGPLLRDYMYAKDIAGAFSALLNSNVEGAVNICTGKVLSIRELSLALARELGHPELLVFEDACEGQPALIVGDNTRLTHEVGYTPQYTVEAAVAEIVQGA